MKEVELQIIVDKAGVTQTLSFKRPRPAYWESFTYSQRGDYLNILQLYAEAKPHGNICQVIMPPCECIVQQVEERDPLIVYSGNICARCHGPLD